MYNNVWGRGEAELLNEKGYKKILFCSNYICSVTGLDLIDIKNRK